MNAPGVPSPNEAPLLIEDFQNIIEPLPLPSQLPRIMKPPRERVVPLPPVPRPVVTGAGNFIPPPKLIN